MNALNNNSKYLFINTNFNSVALANQLCNDLADKIETIYNAVEKE
jgi:hypothetical protein